MQRFGSPPLPLRSYTRRPGVYVILPLDAGLLLTFQGSIHNEVQLPGGGLDPGEHPIPALHREVIEETGWHITAPRFVCRYRRFTHMPEYDLWADKICTIYAARPTRRVSAPLEADHQALWLPVDRAMAQLTCAGDRAAVARYLGLYTPLPRKPEDFGGILRGNCR